MCIGCWHIRLIKHMSERTDSSVSNSIQIL